MREHNKGDREGACLLASTSTGTAARCSCFSRLPSSLFAMATRPLSVLSTTCMYSRIISVRGPEPHAPQPVGASLHAEGG